MGQAIPALSEQKKGGKGEEGEKSEQNIWECVYARDSADKPFVRRAVQRNFKTKKLFNLLWSMWKGRKEDLWARQIGQNAGKLFVKGNG